MTAYHRPANLLANSVMRRRTFIHVLGALVCTVVQTTNAQTETVRRIGFLASGVPATPALLEEQFAPLKELGWIEGKNVVFLRRYSYDKAELLDSYAAELVRLKVDLIVTEGTDATLAVKNATKTIPIVIRSAADPVRTGLVASLARPGGNITGYATTGLDAEMKLLEAVREVLPQIRRVARLDTLTNMYYRAVREETEQAYRAAGLKPIFVAITYASELENAITAIVRQRAEVLVVGGANLLEDNRVRIIGATLTGKLPTVGGGRLFVEAGGLLSYSIDLGELRRRGAAFIDRILRGAKPGDLPIEQPTQFDLGINIKTATALGVVIPPSVLLRATYVVR